MKPEIEGIELWTAQKAPEFYRRLSRSSSEFDWIAVVQPDAISEFGQLLFANGYQIEKDTSRHALADGRWMFCGSMERSPIPEKEE